MFKSTKSKMGVLVISLTLVTWVVTTLLVSYKCTGDFNMTIDTLIVLAIGVLLLVGLILSAIISNQVKIPLRKMEKLMYGVISGKSISLDRKLIKKELPSLELEEFKNSFNDMMRVIIKKNFDLNSEESKTEIILEHMADGVVAFSVSSQVIHMNKAAMSLLGVSNENDFFDKIMKKIGLKMQFDKIMYMPNYKNITEQVKVNDYVLDLVFVPFHSERLTPMGVIMIIKNITENIALDNMRREFVANVSHELKTPLTSIKGYSETILEGGLSEIDKEKFIKVIHNEANRMDRLVADLLQLSRFDYQRNKSIKETKFNLDDLAKDVTEKMIYVASQKGHKLSCSVNMIPPPILADKDSIEQVIINVLSNSIKYTPDNGEINVYVGSVGGKAYIKVVDNGIGIPEKDLQRIFERFYRIDKARSREMGGTGLGLSIVKEIIDRNNGTIEIKSEVGKGTEVIITLPTTVSKRDANKGR